MQQILENISNFSVAATYAFVFTIGLFYLIKVVLLARLAKLSKSTETKFDDLAIDLVKKISWPSALALAIFLAAQLEPMINVSVVRIGFVLVMTWQVARLSGIVFGHIRSMTDDEEGTNVITAFGSILQILVWAVGILVLLGAMGYNVNSIVAGLGIGGVAVALAVKDVMTDAFSSLSIYLDKTFKPGDFISAGEGKEGTVERIGLKSTRLRTPRGELLVISNSNLTDAAIRNFGELNRRRFSDQIVLPFRTSQDKIKQFSDGCCSVLDGVDNAEFLRLHFKDVSLDGLTFELVYYVNSGNYDEFVAAQNKINTQLKAFLEKEGMVPEKKWKLIAEK